MFHPYEIFASVEWIWLLWLICVALLIGLTCRLLQRLSWKQLATGEEGAAYSLSYVMVMPFYLMLVCLIIETSLLMIVKMGTMYAAYAAARSSIVWDSVDAGKARERQERAAIQALTPFASSSKLHAGGPGLATARQGEADKYVATYRAYTANQGPASKRYLVAKYLYAAKATTVAVDKGSGQWDASFTVTVTYRAPLHVPGVSRLLLGDRPAPWKFATCTIQSTATLQSEAPKNELKTLGIGYNHVYE